MLILALLTEVDGLVPRLMVHCFQGTRSRFSRRFIAKLTPQQPKMYRFLYRKICRPVDISRQVSQISLLITKRMTL